MGFDTHMILEGVPAPRSKPPNAHQGINRTLCGALHVLHVDDGERPILVRPDIGSGRLGGHDSP
jgi:hypothetical protein